MLHEGSSSAMLYKVRIHTEHIKKLLLEYVLDVRLTPSTIRSHQSEPTLLCVYFTVTPNSLNEDREFSDLSVEVQALLSSYYKERYDLPGDHFLQAKMSPACESHLLVYRNSNRTFRICWSQWY